MEFKTKYINHKDIGNEYFEGDYKLMMYDIFIEVNKECNLTNIVSNESKNNTIENNTIENNTIENNTIETKEVPLIDCVNNLTISVDSYEKYLKYSKIEKIIITDRTFKIGYLKFKNDISWCKINANTNTKSNTCNYANTMKLLDWIKYSSNTLTNTIFEWNKILEDIYNKCFCENPKIYNLKYSEFIFSYDNKTVVCDISESNRINNSEICSIVNYTNDIILYDIKPSHKLLNYIPSTNLDKGVQYIAEIIESLVAHKSKLNKFRNLCKSVLIIEHKACFNDKYTEIPILTYWLSILLDTLGNENRHLYSRNMNLDAEIYHNICKSRLYIFDKEFESILNKTCSDILSSKHINTIIITTKTESSNIYNYERCISYIITNLKQLKLLSDKTELIHLINLKNNPSKLRNLINVIKPFLFYFLIWCCM